MINFIRRISLTYKLVMIGVIPILALIYFSYVIYREKSEKLETMRDYIDQVEISVELARLNESLGSERLYSFKYLRGAAMRDSMVRQRSKTDSFISLIRQRSQGRLKDFTRYTFLSDLSGTRRLVDSIPNFDPNIVIDYYTRCIYRINYLNSWVPPTKVYLPDDYQNLVGQRLLREMITLIDILRTNIYNCLYTRKYMVETLMGSYGPYTVYKSFQTEFELKASQAAKDTFAALAGNTSFGKMNAYMDTLYKRFKFDSTLTADEWWQLSSQGVSEIKEQQKNLWRLADQSLRHAYDAEKNALAMSIIAMTLVNILIVAFILYVIKNIRDQLQELKRAARRISRGETGIVLGDIPRGIVGNLAKSILQIEKNNLVLAKAAGEIGKGSFGVHIRPRSEQDILGHSLVQMKSDLEKYNSEKDRLQKDTLQLVNQRDEFFSMTSHELKTPVTTLKAYVQMLKMDANQIDGEQRVEVYTRMDKQINKLVALINDLLDTSRLQHNELHYTKSVFKLNMLVQQVIGETQLAYPAHRIIFQKNVQGEVFADFDRIQQVLSNLLVNAIKYGGDSRDIIVRLDKTDTSMICSVKDFGFGIKDEDKQKIFDRFYRVQGNNMQTYPGLGIGLFISKEIIHSHDGKIWFESTDGKGSTFIFELPLNGNAIA